MCEKIDADVNDVAKAIGLDDRIGSKFLQAGPGYGGSCFPKDTHSIAAQARSLDAPLNIIESVIETNNQRKIDMANRVISALDSDAKRKTVAVLGLTFKPNTDDMRDSPSLTIIPRFQTAGATIKAYDPEGMEQAQKFFDDVIYGETAYDTMKGADVLVIITEWDEFRALKMNRVKELMNRPLMIDFRNVYDPRAMQEKGFNYISIGREPVKPGFM